MCELSRREKGLFKWASSTSTGCWQDTQVIYAWFLLLCVQCWIAPFTTVVPHIRQQRSPWKQLLCIPSSLCCRASQICCYQTHIVHCLVMQYIIFIQSSVINVDAFCIISFQARTASQAADVRHSATPSSVPATWRWGSVIQICAWPVALQTTGTAKGCPARTAASKEV